MSIKKVLAFTSIRSDYDLLSELYKKIHYSKHMELALIVSGAHLSKTYGYTINQIKEDKLPIIAEIETLIDSDSNSSRIKTASLLMQNCLHDIEKFKPDVILFAGDREDAIVAALVGAYLKIPTIHFFGGDHAMDGNVDNPIRHACSKLASLHFVIHEEHKKRLVEIGENPKRIFVIGSPALDKFKLEPYINKHELLQMFPVNDWEEYALVIFHPILGEENLSGKYINQILSSLKENKINAFVSYPNTDSGNQQIIDVIQKYKDDPSFYFYKNLNRNLFINLMKNAIFMIGNSSSGLLEAPILPLGVINVGNRQKGRKAAKNVIFVNQDKNEIQKAIDYVTSEQFQKSLKDVQSIYGDGDSVQHIYELLLKLNFSEYLYKKEDPLGGVRI